MKRESPGERLMIYIDQTDQHGRHALYTEIVHRAKAAGLAALPSCRASKGSAPPATYTPPPVSTSSVMCRWWWSSSTPPERIEAFLPTVDELVADGLMVRQPVDMIIYRGGKAR
jgi:PII-like signaling protein